MLSPHATGRPLCVSDSISSVRRRLVIDWTMTFIRRQCRANVVLWERSDCPTVRQASHSAGEPPRCPLRTAYRTQGDPISFENIQSAGPDACSERAAYSFCAMSFVFYRSEEAGCGTQTHTLHDGYARLVLLINEKSCAHFNLRVDVHTGWMATATSTSTTKNNAARCVMVHSISGHTKTLSTRLCIRFQDERIENC